MDTYYRKMEREQRELLVKELKDTLVNFHRLYANNIRLFGLIKESQLCDFMVISMASRYEELQYEPTKIDHYNMENLDAMLRYFKTANTELCNENEDFVHVLKKSVSESPADAFHRIF